MNIFRILTFGLYKPFTHDPKDFKLKLVESWFSQTYISFRYTANGGRWWKTIKCSQRPSNTITDDWSYGDLSYKFYGDFNHEKSKFSSYQKILDYERKEVENYYTQQEKTEKERGEYYQKIKDRIKSINE